MTNPPPFDLEHAEDVLPDRAGDFLLPICLPASRVMLGEYFAVVVLETLEGHRIGVPMGHQALSNLRDAITEALTLLQAGDGDAVQ